MLFQFYYLLCKILETLFVGKMARSQMLYMPQMQIARKLCTLSLAPLTFCFFEVELQDKISYYFLPQISSSCDKKL